jgi:hypothetical protein
MATLVADFAEILKDIPAGAWVAISERQHQALAYGADARSVLNAARGKGERLPLMLRVPATDAAMAA